MIYIRFPSLTYQPKGEMSQLITSYYDEGISHSKLLIFTKSTRDSSQFEELYEHENDYAL